MQRFLIVAALGAMSAGSLLCGGCSHEVAHSESDKPGLLGGNTHKESTTYQNPDGSLSTDKSTVHTSN